MIHFLIYIIKSTFCLTLFYLFFKVLLSRETFFRFNRFVLLAGMTVCAILPAIELKISQATPIQEPIGKIKDFFMPSTPSNLEIAPDDWVVIMSEMEILEYSDYPETAGEIPLSSATDSFSVIRIVKIIYGAGCLITSLFLAVSISKMIRIIREGTKIRKGKYMIVCVREQICPFSWGRYIVLNEDAYRQNPDEILSHEEVHIRKQHSLDLLFAELFILFHWFNPVAWLLKRELQDVHEYEADRGVINQGIDATKYQLMLVKKTVGLRSYAIANSFNHSKIKNRITMMLKEKSTRWARLKLLLFAPLAVVLLQAFARPETVRTQESQFDSEITTIFEESKQPEEKPDVQPQEKSFEQQEMKTILRNDTLQVNQSKYKFEGRSDSIIVKGLPKSAKKLTIKGAVSFIDGDQEITLNGDNIEINLNPMQIPNHIEPIKAEELKKYMNNLKDQFDTTSNLSHYFSVSPAASSLVKMFNNPDSSRFYAFNNLREERIKQSEQRLKERIKFNEERQKQIEKQQKERLKQVVQRTKEYQKLLENRKKQSEQRLNEQLKRNKERQKQIEKQYEERLKESQKQIEELQKELEKKSESRSNNG